MSNELTCWDEAYITEKNILSLVTAGFIIVACVVCGDKVLASLLTVPFLLITSDAWQRNYSHVYEFTTADKVEFIIAVVLLTYLLYPRGKKATT